jgi:hypothetical protein
MEKKINTAQAIEVSDIALAAALCASGFKLDYVWGDRRKTFVFIAENDEEIRKAMNDYQNRTLSVDARRYAEEMRQLKTLIFNG